METHQEHHPCKSLIYDEIHNFFLAIFQGHEILLSKDILRIKILQNKLYIYFLKTLKVRFLPSMTKIKNSIYELLADLIIIGIQLHNILEDVPI